MGRKKSGKYSKGSVLFSAKGKIVIKDIYEGNEYLIYYFDAGYEKVCKRTYFYQCCEMYDSSVQVGDTYESETGIKGFVVDIQDDGVLVHFEDGCVDVFANWFDFKNGKIDANGKIVKPKGRRKGTSNAVKVEDTETDERPEEVTEEVGEASGESNNPEEDIDDSEPEVLKEYENGLVDLYYRSIGVVGIEIDKSVKAEDCYTYMTYDLYERLIMSKQEDEDIGKVGGIKITADCDSVTAYDSYVSDKLRKNNIGEYMKCVAFNDDKCDIYFPDNDSVITNIKVSLFDSGAIHSYNKSYKHISAKSYGIYSSDDSEVALGWNAPHKGRLGAIKCGENSIPVKIVAYRSVSDLDIQFKNGRLIKGIDYFTWLYYDLVWSYRLVPLSARLSGNMEFDNPVLKLDSNLRIALHRMDLRTVSDLVGISAVKIKDMPNSNANMRAKVLILKEVAESLEIKGTIKKQGFD